MAAPNGRPPRSDASYTLASLPKTWRFTQALPADPRFPTPAASHRTPRDAITPRLVKGALFTWVRPEGSDDPELLATSPAALQDLGLLPSEAATEDFRQTAAGNRLWGWEDGAAPKPTDSAADLAKQQQQQQPYPWAQCYGGFQFGNWAGQLGDGRAISLFEVPVSGTSEPPRSYEVQLKGAGSTPYSRFADGQAVLRSSIREFVASEALHGLGIPTTRALALTLLKDVLVQRERLEPGAVVVRFAESWLRLGTFDLLHARGNRTLTLQLATYAAETIFGGWDTLPGRLPDGGGDANAAAVAALLEPPRGVAADALQGPPASAENRFARFYREVVRRNAVTVAYWQAYGFMNGVLNTDNTSIYGLSMDFGPFAFLDNFDPTYTPNHDDHHLRYSYQNQPSIVWWNLVRFGEAIGAVIAAGGRVDDPVFIKDGIMGLAKADVTPLENGRKPSEAEVEKAAESFATQGEAIIMRAGTEYKNLFMATYKRLFAARLGLSPPTTADLADPDSIDPLITSLLEVMQSLELDFNLFFRRLSNLRLADLATDEQRHSKAAIFFYREGIASGTGEEDARERIAKWLAEWRRRILAQSGQIPEGDADAGRIRAMKAVNPTFIPRGWILDEVIRRVEKNGERDVLRRIIHMALHPFEDSWHGRVFDGQPYSGDPEEELRWTQDVPRKDRAMQCSCSS